MSDVSQILNLVSGVGVSGILTLIIYGLMKGWFVTGREHAAAVAQNTAMMTELISNRAEIQSLQSRIRELEKQLAEEKGAREAIERQLEEKTRELNNLIRRAEPLRVLT